MTVNMSKTLAHDDLVGDDESSLCHDGRSWSMESESPSDCVGTALYSWLLAIMSGT